MAPGGQYPLQLQQAVDILHYIVHNADKKASNVLFLLILPADSSLTELDRSFSVETLALEILHWASLPPSPPLHSNFCHIRTSKAPRGAKLISFWVDFQMTAPSFTRNQHKDMIGGVDSKSRLLSSWVTQRPMNIISR